MDEMENEETRTIIIDVGADEVNRSWLISNVCFCVTLLAVVLITAGCAFSPPIGFRQTSEEIQVLPDGSGELVVTWPQGTEAQDVITIDDEGRAKSFAPLGTE